MLKKREKENIKEIILECESFYDIEDNISITPSLAIMVNNYSNSQNIDEHNDYETRKLNYIKNKHENMVRKQYNKIIVNLYQDGHIIINNEDVDLKDLYILYLDNSHKYYLTSTKSSYTDIIRKSKDEYPYNKAVRFTDSTLFISLINEPSIDIEDNTIIINDNEILLNLLDNWDELLHNKIWFTESINNKKILKED